LGLRRTTLIMIEFSFVDSENIIYVKRKGEIHTNDIFEIIDKINMHFPNKKHLYIFQDTTESIMKYDIADLESMILKFQEKLQNYSAVKIANLTHDPLETATALIFEEMASKISKLHHKTFSSEEYAKHWLQKGMVKS
jgi:hypothetical protein